MKRGEEEKKPRKVPSSFWLLSCLAFVHLFGLFLYTQYRTAIEKTQPCVTGFCLFEDRLFGNAAVLKVEATAHHTDRLPVCGSQAVVRALEQEIQACIGRLFMP